MSIELNQMVIERGRYMAEAMVYDYETDSKRLPAGAPQVLDTFLAKADECMLMSIGAFDDDRAGSHCAPAHVRLDYAKEFVSWLTVSMELLRHVNSTTGEQPCLEILRRGHVPPLRFTESEQHVFNSYQRMVKLINRFVEAMPLRSFAADQEFTPFVEDQTVIAEASLRLAAHVCDDVLALMHAIRADGSLPGKALWVSKRCAFERKIDELLFEQDQSIADSRGEWFLQQLIVELPDGDAVLQWKFKPVERRFTSSASTDAEKQ